MKFVFIYMFFAFAAIRINAQTQSATQIKQKMAEIRRSTNWNDPNAAKKAKEEIQKLAKQLTLQGQKQNVTGNEELQEELEKDAEYKAELHNQILKNIEQGEEADILLAEPIRKEIVEDYKDDESPTIKNQEYFEKMTMLCVDMSLPTVQRTIEQMKKFKSIKTLIITGGKHGAPVNLDDLLTRAANYPLENLYIINFKNFVTSIPSKVARFKKLILLSFIDNKIQKIPNEMSGLANLKTFYIDVNPVKTLLPVISNYKQLANLGIGKTNISDAEVDKIKKLLPNCNILQK